ncbi:MAG: OadG family protein [Nitrospinota bacterium]
MSIINSGLILMAVGMTAVFIFLLLMIAMMYGVKWTSDRISPEKPAGPDFANIAAISAAVHKYIMGKK